MTRILGALTIGQSPRTDMIPEMKPILGPGVEIIEAGALDGLTHEEIRCLAPDPGDYVLVTRTSDGTPVKVAEKHILLRMQEKIDYLAAAGAEVIVLVCTGEFPPFRCDRIIVEPQRVLADVTRAVAGELRLGVIVPDADQIPQAMTRWKDAASEVFVESASPYGPAGSSASKAPFRPIQESALNLKIQGAQAVVMDCMGYTVAMKDLVKSIMQAPVILARTTVARITAELL